MRNIKIQVRGCLNNETEKKQTKIDIEYIMMNLNVRQLMLFFPAEFKHIVNNVNSATSKL